MCAILCAAANKGVSREMGERYGTKKNLGVSGEEKKD